MNYRWRPVLAGDLAVAALVAVDAIAAELPAVAAWLTPGAAPDLEPFSSAALATGDPGQALFYAYLALHAPDAEASQRAIDRLDRATDCVAALPLGDSLYSGFPGIGWVNEHLCGRLFEQEEDANDEVDQAVLASLSRPPWGGDYDLINGLVGLGVYARERLPRPAAVRCLELVVERLAARAERSAAGAAWPTPPEDVPAAQRADYPDGYYNLGAAHGVAGVIALLASACRAGVAVGVARPLLEEAMRWLMAHQMPRESGYGFPHFAAPLVPSQKCRIAWCYGDLGMAATLAAAARAVERPDWERAALALALAAADRPFEGSAVSDGGVCHGAAGVAHLFNRLYQASGEERLADAARRWYAKTLEMREPGRGAGGFRSLHTNPRSGEKLWTDDPGFLAGSAGIGLSLLAAVSPVEPEWDRLLLVSL
jgi:lantibiotic modifying enzyme